MALGARWSRLVGPAQDRGFGYGTTGSPRILPRNRDLARPPIPSRVMAEEQALATPHHADLARSIRLFRAFRLEQSDPDFFYRMLAADAVGQLRTYTDLAGAVVLDVGGGA